MRQTQTHLAQQLLSKSVCGLAIVFGAISPAHATAQSQPPQLQQLIADASAARDHGDIPGAIALYQQAVDLNPQWADGWWYLGSMQYGTDHYDPAVVALSRYIELTPNAGPAYALRGLSEFEETKYPESLQDLQHAIALGAANQPRNAGIILYHEAILLTKMGSFEQALGKFAEMVKHGAVNPDILTAIGLAGMRMPLFPTEVDAGQAPIVAAAGQAAAAFMNSDSPGADRQFQDLFVRYPSVENLHFFYGYLLFTSDSDKAIELFKQELAVSPSNAEAHSMLAWAYGLRNDYASSLVDAKKAVDENPNLPLAQLVLGRALVGTGDLQAGVDHLLIVASADPQNLDAHITLAKAYSKLGRKDDAWRERMQCLAITGHEATPDAKM